MNNYKNETGYIDFNKVKALMASINYNSDMISYMNDEYTRKLKECDNEYIEKINECDAEYYECAKLWNEFYRKGTNYQMEINSLSETISKIDEEAALIGGKMSPQQEKKREEALTKLESVKAEYEKAKIASNKEEAKSLIEETRAKKAEIIKTSTDKKRSIISAGVGDAEYVQARNKELADLTNIYIECYNVIKSKEQEIENTMNMMKSATAPDEIQQRAIEISELIKEKNQFIGTYTRILDTIKATPSFPLIKDNIEKITKENVEKEAARKAEEAKEEVKTEEKSDAEKPAEEEQKNDQNNKPNGGEPSVEEPAIDIPSVEEPVVEESTNNLHFDGKPLFVDEERLPKGYEWMSAQNARNLGILDRDSKIKDDKKTDLAKEKVHVVKSVSVTPKDLIKSALNKVKAWYDKRMQEMEENLAMQSQFSDFAAFGTM